ncbi:MULTISPECIES: PQQ-binding-like beta-propeller repeat protein [unclassified Kitasatospora]|uniref:outer membrane protein assembly factor BamB family protein n=1 Tax=unclassified Kitasatospora TaxID=2633591 RepID=UPI00070EF16E|nr:MULTISPECIES: PQQ-binding-like beta-propeller repeat protein [unclassified Kitasatospora]KQV04514.1 hypothetical protein ASC99_14000 [Kitasatospora sp. Root107]KRB60956.1 hypothetical protein ASE03_11505 [Kitasatospora sp. Root187]
MIGDAIPMRVKRDGGLWTLIAPPDTLSRPVVRGNRVFVLVDGRPVACDRADGTVVWQSPHRVIGEQDYWEARLTATGGHLVAPTARTDRSSPGPAALSVLEAESGSLLWEFDPGELAEYRADRETLVVWHGRVGGRPRQLAGFDLTTGSRLWEHTFESVSTMELVDGRVIASVKDAQGYAVSAFDARTGAGLWRRTEPSGILCVPNNGARSGPSLVFVWGWTKARLLSLAVADGTTVGDFSIPRKDQQYSPLIIDGGRTVWVAAASRAAAVLSFRPGTPTKEPSHTFHLVRHPLSHVDVPIAPADGWLYAIDDGDRLLANPIGSGGTPAEPLPLAGVRAPARPPDRLLARLHRRTEPRLSADPRPAQGAGVRPTRRLPARRSPDRTAARHRALAPPPAVRDPPGADRGPGAAGRGRRAARPAAAGRR